MSAAGCFDASVGSNWTGKDGQDLSGWNSGTHDFTYDPVAGTITITGGFIGVPKAINDAADVTAPAASVVYDVVKLVECDVDTLIIETTRPDAASANTGLVYWRTVLVSYGTTTPITIDECPVVVSGTPTVAAADPTVDAQNVISIYSDTYTDISDVNTNPQWSQATKVTGEVIGTNNMLKLADFNYQGIDFATNAQDVSNMDYIHVDMWTSNATAVNLSLISTGPKETPYAMAITKDTWVGYDIPLSSFSSVVDLKDVIQLKFDGGDAAVTIFLDNIYFYSGSSQSTAVTAMNIDYETTASSIMFTGFEGASNISVVSNPDATGNTSANVAKLEEAANAQAWAGVEYVLGGKIDFTNDQTITIDFYSATGNVDMVLKLESSADANVNKEVYMKYNTANTWETLTFTFDATDSNKFDKVVIFGQMNQSGTWGTNSVAETHYFDNIKLGN
jgi:hypothetical protein